MTDIEANSPSIQIAHINKGDWSEHPRFKNIELKALISKQVNPFANVNTVRVPPGGEISDHTHISQVETIYVIQGQAVIHYQGEDHDFSVGSIIAMPSRMEHSLRNESDQDVLLLTIFTPPL